MRMNARELRGNLLLLLTALIWGLAFVAQKLGMEHLGSFSFNAIRTLIGALALLPIAARRRAGDRKSGDGDRRTLIVGGALCGLALFVASNLQQAGLQYTTVGKAGFITALYILIVPLLGLLMGKRVRALFWVAVGLALVGMYLLTMSGSLSISRGDLLVTLSAIGFSVHILVIDHFSPKADGVRMATIQFFVCGLLSMVPMLLWERPSLAAVGASWAPLLYSGMLSCGVGYTLQILAQRDVKPVVASLLMSLESVFAALAGWLVLGQRLSARELAGCALVFAAILLAQLPQKRRASPLP